MAENIRSSVGTAWDNMKTKLSTTMENIKTSATNARTNMKTSIGNTVDNLSVFTYMPMGSAPEKSTDPYFSLFLFFFHQQVFQ